MPKSFQTNSSYKINMKNILSDLIDYDYIGKIIYFTLILA